jgi:hypothetical protein
VQLGLWQAGDEGVEIGHGVKAKPGAAKGKLALTAIW